MDNKNKFILLLVGAGLMLAGIIFLVVNLGHLLTRNWWTLIVLVGAAAGLFYAWMTWKNGKAWTSSNVAVPGGIGIALLVIFLIYFLTVGWGIIWPAIVIVLGLAVILYVTARKPAQIINIVKDQLDGDPNTPPKPPV